MGEVFKRLIAIDPKPDIILILVNNKNYKDFFTCLTYLEENRNLEFDIEDFIKNKAKFNNFLEIQNQEIIDNINNHFRIGFLKDYILASFLSETQIEELNTFLMLHSNTVVCYINSVVAEKLANIDQLINDQPFSTQSFFSELFYLLRFSFVELRGNFCQVFTQHKLHTKILDFLFSTFEAIKSSAEQHQELKIRVCMEIINFVCKNYPQATPEVFCHEGPSRAHPTLLDMLPELLENHQVELSHQILDVFQMQMAMRMDILDESFQRFVVEHVVPALATTIRRLHAKESSGARLKYLNFSVELFLSFFALQIKPLTEVLMRENVLDEVADIMAGSRSKFDQLLFLKYLREVLTAVVDKTGISFKKSFFCLWRIYLSNRKRDSLLKGVLLSIMKALYEKAEAQTLKFFVKVIRKHQDVVKKESLLMQIMARYEALKLHLKDQNLNLNLTSESESSMTHETLSKSQLKIKESFLEDAQDMEFGPENEPFNRPFSGDRKKGDNNVMIRDLVEKIQKNKSQKQEEKAGWETVRPNRLKDIGVPARLLSVRIDDDLLKKREKPDEPADYSQSDIEPKKESK